MPANIDQIIFQTSLVTIGSFRCPVGHPRFRDSGPIRQSCFVFPRSSVVIEHEHRRPFVSDAALSTLYNTGQRYERRPVSLEGDRCDWFGIAPGLLRDAVRRVDPSAADDAAGAMRYAHAPVRPTTYLRQRRLFARAASRQLTGSVAIEEEVALLLDQVLRAAYGRKLSGVRPMSGARAQRQRVEVAEAARAFLAREFSKRLTLSEVADAAGSSPFHLCRAFREVLHSTVHGHLTTLRLRAALERIADGADLTTVALEVGFSSHSHFSAAFRRQFGVAPSRSFRARF